MPWAEIWTRDGRSRGRDSKSAFRSPVPSPQQVQNYKGHIFLMLESDTAGLYSTMLPESWEEECRVRELEALKIRNCKWEVFLWKYTGTCCFLVFYSTSKGYVVYRAIFAVIYYREMVSVQSYCRLQGWIGWITPRWFERKVWIHHNLQNRPWHNS